MCQSTILDFNDERMVIELPLDSYDVEGVENINQDDIIRIHIERDNEYFSVLSYNFIIQLSSHNNPSKLIGNWIKHIWDTTNTMYKSVLEE